MYRTIDAAMWSDPKFRDLCPRSKLMFVYLITNPHSHVGGIYYLPAVIAAHETGLTVRDVNTLWHTLSGAGLCRFDQKTNVIWVLKMFAYQGRGDKNERAVSRHLATLHNSCLVHEFLERYPAVRKHSRIPYPIPYPAQDQTRTPDQEQDQEQDQEEEDSGEPAPPASPPPVAVLSFPVVGSKSKTEWSLTADMVAENQALYPGIDVLAESRKALAWIKANPGKRKTAKGMPAFLVNWLNRSTNQGGPSNGRHFAGGDVGRDSRLSSPPGKYAHVAKRIGETPPEPGGGEGGRPDEGPQPEADRPGPAGGNPGHGFG